MPIKKQNELMSWLLLIAGVLLLLEAVFNGENIVFTLLFCGVLIYFGRKRMPRRSGKLMFWLGLFILLINILNLFAFKFLLVAVILYIIVKFYQSKQNPILISPRLEHTIMTTNENIYTKEPLLKNIGFGTQQTPDHVYEWSDINIQCPVGDTIIDLSQTLLPVGESVIFIRGLIGNLSIHIPYEIEVAVNHSVLAGNTMIFDQHDPKMFNKVVSYRTKDYVECEKKVKIVTSLIAGSLEVKRV
ncbi:cell wall-active antibiotics response protein [Fictibacillus nanhaiensis]|uniref:cell wall-active antibiotics response protein LiaF n=1 Tax=Fictibacillus nanhaiensis TaxID=742169 RepID=UPI001C9520A9|nr:cell wall-active antibiotics response protein LiaF [Fictibacillus nanhaiensis]MBY6037503.1 cell wall-active antibiotics response protein [Fictibacillus nanhaiensis]